MNVRDVRDLVGRLPDIGTLRMRCQAIAALDRILSRGADLRVHTFNRGSFLYNNGSGDFYYVHFDPHGAIVIGFDHESDMSPWVRDDQRPWPGVVDAVPDVFQPYLDDTTDPPSITFCLWRLYRDERWHTGDISFPPLFGTRTDPDGAGMLERLCDPDPAAYVRFADGYHGVLLPPDLVAHVYAHGRLDDRLVAALAPDLTLDDVSADLTAIGYPW